MLIEVKKKHIANGRQNHICSCPVALAIKEATAIEDCGIFYSDITVNGRRLHMPRSVYRFINRFDKGKPVEPFSFKLNLPF